MENKDWLVTDEGQCEPRPASKAWNLIRHNYYFHRFLTEITDLLDQAPNELDEWDFLPQIRMGVRRLITNSYWLQTKYLEPIPPKGIAVLTLYDEIGYPLTVQNVTLSPGVVSPIHNHGTWGVVAILKGQEQHTFWKRAEKDLQFPNHIEPLCTQIFGPGEIISFMPQAIHQVTVIGDQPALTFNLYGDTPPCSRFEFNSETKKAHPF